MSEETPPGGNTDGVVHKRAAPWTPSVHALLRHLEQAGVDGVPRVLGLDEQGRQMLTYLPGDMIGGRDPWPAWAYTDSTLVQLDAYRYDGDRRAFGAVIAERARRQAGVIRGMAEAGDRAAIALLPIASRLENSASCVQALPGDFWTP